MAKLLNQLGNESGGDYLIDHSANLFMINYQGKLIHLIPFILPKKHILKVLKEEKTD